MQKFKGFKDYLSSINEYHITHGIVPSHEAVPESLKHKNGNYGEVEGHQIHHSPSHTYVVNKETGETVAHIGHKKVKHAPAGRLAISNITKSEGSKVHMDEVIHHLINKGHSLQSDEMNTSKAHALLMRTAKRNGIHSHIEDGEGNIVPHEGDITSPENQKKYSTEDENGMPKDWSVQKHKIVFGKK